MIEINFKVIEEILSYICHQKRRGRNENILKILKRATRKKKRNARPILCNMHF